MTSTTSSITTADGLTLLTRLWKCPDPKAHVLLIHGLGEHSGRWDNVGSFLVDRGYTAHSFDLRGHGGSGGRRVHIESFDDFLDDVELVFNELPEHLPRVIYAHSMGGLIATGYAVSDRRQPDLYVLSAPALEADIPVPLQITSKVLGRVVPKLPLPNSVKGDQLSRDPSVGERYFADPLVQTKATTGFGSVMLEAMSVVRGRLDSFTRPALVIHGADDPLVPPQASAPLAAVPAVERKLFPGLRHETHHEPEKDEVLGFVADWLDAQLV
jgi:alpha-beta hydrolase superfamily lysophospholipase